MNKKSLIVSAAVLFTMAGMNISYAADENTSDLQSFKTPIETAKPVPLGEEPLPHEFKAPPSGAPHHFDGPGKPGPKHFERKHPSKAEMEAKKAEIEKRLKLTDEQKNEIELQKQKDHDVLQQRIKDLLPDALTAGLSHAYAKQCDEEKTERDKSLKVFYWSIGIMTVFATIPFCLGLTFRYGLGKTWEDVISYLPQLACLMLPLYLPMLWVAFSSSRKANLSKRLIEEYAHKVALSKTFQGLEEQISSLDNSETAMELKVKLLYNLVSVSAENPGKLIPNYNKADNPLIEFMDKSIALSESLEKLKNIPGAAIIAKRILAKQEEKREQIANKALEETKEVE